MPVRDGSISADNNTDLDKETMPRRYSDTMDDHVSTRNVRRRSESSRTGRDRELRNRVVMNNGSRSSTRVRHRPEQYRPITTSPSKRSKLLRPRSASHLEYLRELGRSDEVETVTEEDGVTEDDERIFNAPTRRRRKSMSSPEHSSSANVSFQSRKSTRMANGHSNKILDDSHELEGVRRSTRQRKLTYDSFNTSWIYGAQSVRGYRMPTRKEGDHSEEDEEEEEETGEESGEERVQTGEEQGAESGEDVKGKEIKEEKEESGEETDEKEEAEQSDEKGEGGGKEAGDKENFEDMYSRVKRPRRKRIMFAQDCTTRTRSRSRKEESSDDEDDDEPSSEDGQQRPQSPRRRSKYNFRQRKPKLQRFQIEEMRAEPLRRAAMSLLRSPIRRKRRRQRFGRPSSSSSSSDSEYDRKKARNRNMCLPVNYSTAEKSAGILQTIKSGGKGATTNLADTDPMELDPSIRFTHVGGLDEHIRCLKEMVVFPMLYPEIFDKFKVQPPKGVLFHGPPGTGKTLLARALANECSQGARRVAFFMRKGADCLSKWVGESERQLRLLFDQAYQMRPSIIFFDELDGLAPVRSCKQDQIHASIVSTLLALMDGLKNRGEVLLIGATNRIDAIDPALRRPGRFDRELFFPLPAAKERLEILNIHMNTWEQPPAPELVSHLSEVSSGYCGSDLKALCTEAVIQGLRRRYPQIYESSEKLLLDAGQVNVEKCDFQRAQLGIVPAAHRVACAPAHQLASLVKPLMECTLTKVVSQLKAAFPHAIMKSAVNCKLLPCPVPYPRMVLVGEDTQGQVAYLGPAILHHMEHVSVHSLELGTLFGTPSTTPEEVCVQLFREARRQLPAVVYIPEIDKWWSLVPHTVQALLTSHLTSIEPNTALLLLASSNCSYTDLPREVQDLFSEYRGEVYPMINPSKLEREEFFKPLFLIKPILPIAKLHSKKSEVLEKLPIAPPPLPPKLTEIQSADIYKKEEMTLRELRIFLREICGKLARNKQFFMFVQPVDLEEAPDYLEIIKEPMDLETIMSKIDRHEFECAKDFLEDINLICRNALEYNPDRSNQGKMIRHRACYLNDTAHALIKAEMDSDFEDLCKEISVNRKKRAFDANKLAPDFVYTSPASNKDAARQKDAATGSGKAAAGNDSLSTNNPDDEGSSSKKQSQTPVSGSEPRPKKRRSPWARGMLPPRKRNKRAADDSKDGASPGADGRNTPLDDENSEEEHLTKSPAQKHHDAQEARTPSPAEPEPESAEDVEMAHAANDQKPVVDGIRRLSAEVAADVQVDRVALEKQLTRTLDLTENLPLTSLLDLHAQLARIVHSHDSHTNRTSMPRELEGEIDRFKRLVRPHFEK